MTVRLFLSGSVLATGIFWGIWLLVINWINPIGTPVVGLVLFFLTLFLALASTAAFGGYILRRFITPGQFAAYRVRVSLRQAVWLGLLLDLLLFLQMQRLLRWWVTLIIIILFLSLELLFLTYDQSTIRRRRTKAPRS